MSVIVDTGFLYATLDRADQHHARVVAFLSDELGDDDLVLPEPILVELTYLLAERLGHEALRRFVATLVSSSRQLVSLQPDDLRRVHEVLDRYADARLDFVDACVTAIAERLNISTILTVDRRHFHMIRPNHCDHFTVLP